jgi:hypothetical protein
MGSALDPNRFHMVINDSPNGLVSFRFGSAMDVYNAKECFVTESKSQFPITFDSIKIWQTAGAATAPTGGGGLSFLRY